MAGNRRSEGGCHTGIKRPRLPRLEPIDSLAVLQYRFGRKHVIKKLEHLAWKFENQLEPIIKPYIRSTTEPWEILRWYYDQIMPYIDEFHSNIIEWLEWSDMSNTGNDRHQRLSIMDYKDPGSIYVIGTDWLKYIRPSFRKWYQWIYSELNSCGMYKAWDFISEYDSLEMLKDRFEVWGLEEKDLDPENNEEHREYLLLVEQAEAICEAQRKFNWGAEKPDKYPTPKNRTEQRLLVMIKRFVKFRERWGNRKVWSYAFDSDQFQEDGYLPLEQMYVITDNGIDWSDYFDLYIYQEWIEMQANNFGVCPWAIECPEDEQFDEDQFDWNPPKEFEDILLSLHYVEHHIVKQNSDKLIDKI